MCVEDNTRETIKYISVQGEYFSLSLLYLLMLMDLAADNCRPFG